MAYAIIDPEIVIPKFLELQKQLEDTSNFVCFDTKNGRRLILRTIGTKECLPVDSRLRLVSYGHDTTKPPYASAYELLLGYYTDGDVRIDDIFITTNMQEALDYLSGRPL